MDERFKLIKIFIILIIALTLILLVKCEVNASDVFDENVNEGNNLPIDINTKIINSEDIELDGEILTEIENDIKENDDLFNWGIEKEVKFKKDEKIKNKIDEKRKQIEENRENMDNIKERLMVYKLSDFYSEPARMAYAVLNEGVNDYVQSRLILTQNIVSSKETIQLVGVWISRVGDDYERELLTEMYSNFKNFYYNDLLILSQEIIKDLEHNKISVRVKLDDTTYVKEMNKYDIVPLYNKDVDLEMNDKRKKELGNILITILNVMEQEKQEIDRGYLLRKYENITGVELSPRQVMPNLIEGSIQSRFLHKLLIAGLVMSNLAIIISGMKIRIIKRRRLVDKTNKDMDVIIRDDEIISEKQQKGEIKCQDVVKQI